MSEAKVIYSLDPRLGRPRRGRPDPPADRAPRRRCGPCPQLRRDPPGRRQRDGRGLARSRSTDDGPTALVLTRQDLPVLEGTAGDDGVPRGAYVLAEPDATASPTSSSSAPAARSSVCVDAAELLAEDGIAARVVSMPSLGLLRRAGRRLPGRGAAARRADARRRGRRSPSAGTAGPTTASASTASAPPRPAAWPSPSSGFTARQRGRPGHGSCSSNDLPRRTTR